MNVELLAPAGNIEIARSAILSGADAIYIGPSSFGARKAASNSMDDLARLIEYAHIFDVKVYLTMNTILYDDEIDEAYKIARRAEEIGADALIVQDMAYQMMGLKRIPLHASTQTYNFNLDRIRLVASSGFDRIVLERSLTLSEIRTIRSMIPIEIECFIHGAMCVGFSGRCYLSQYLCGRSGNRGVCSQACRSQYDLFSDDGRLMEKSSAVLSVSDINLAENIRDLIDAGVCSLKIEGRLKDESYVVNNVAYYNGILNSLGVERTSKGNVTCSFTPNPRKSFSRGFSGNMFLYDSRAKVGAATRSLGEKIGTVDRVDGNIIHIGNATSAGNGIILHNGDGISWYDRSNQYGAYVNGINNKGVLLSSAENIKVGDTLYRNLDKEFRPCGKDVHRKMGIQIDVNASEKVIELSIMNFSRQYEYSFQEAKNQELARNNIIQALSRTGDTPFVVDAVNLRIEKIPFISSSLLNSLRRNFLEEYAKYLSKEYGNSIRNRYPSEDLIFPASISYEWNVANQMAAQFYRNHGSLEIEPAFELQDNASLKGKELMHSRYCIRRQRGICPKENPHENVASPLVLENNGKKIKVLFDCRNCQMILSIL